MRTLNFVCCCFLATAAGCFPPTHDKNGNPYSQVPGGVECSWMTQKTLGCPEIVGPVQRGPMGQACQTLKRGKDYETRCDNGVLPPNPY
jgi:hypothetical protein